MNKIEKDLLLKDLCARLPYGVKFQGEDSNVYTLDTANYFALQVENTVFKPYLRPMSSMTEEEKKEWHYLYLPLPHKNEATETERRIDWLNEHHFDYRGLIEKGLAIEVTEENNPYK